MWSAERGVNFGNYGRVPPDSRVDLGRLFSVVSPVDICGSYASLSFGRCVLETRSSTGLPLEQGSKSRWKTWVTAPASVCFRLKPSGPGTGEPVTAVVRISRRYGTCKVGGFSNESHLCSVCRLVCCGARPRPVGRRQPGGGRRRCLRSGRLCGSGRLLSTCSGELPSAALGASEGSLREELLPGALCGPVCGSRTLCGPGPVCGSRALRSSRLRSASRVLRRAATPASWSVCVSVARPARAAARRPRAPGACARRPVPLWHRSPVRLQPRHLVRPRRLVLR